MLEKIDAKLKTETEKILSKENLTIEEIQFLYNERSHLEAIKLSEENKLKEEQNQKKYEELTKSMMQLVLNP